MADPEPVVARIRHAGAIFMGRYTAEALGDYCAGPNHVLPTSRTARFSSPLGVYDFQKRSSLIMASPAGAADLGPHRLGAGPRRGAHGPRAVGGVSGGWRWRVAGARRSTGATQARSDRT